jgi:hypothetical protein
MQSHDLPDEDRALNDAFASSYAGLDGEALARLAACAADLPADGELATLFDASAAHLDELTERRLQAPYLRKTAAPMRRYGAWLGLATAAVLAVWVIRPTDTPAPRSTGTPLQVAQVEPVAMASTGEALTEFGPQLEADELQIADNENDPGQAMGMGDADLDMGLDALHGLDGETPLAMP